MRMCHTNLCKISVHKRPQFNYCKQEMTHPPYDYSDYIRIHNQMTLQDNKYNTLFNIKIQ